eukprot:scaffold10931_cov75-Phaeocystis_antarctica.AAC.3
MCAAGGLASRARRTAPPARARPGHEHAPGPARRRTRESILAGLPSPREPLRLVVFDHLGHVGHPRCDLCLPRRAVPLPHVPLEDDLCVQVGHSGRLQLDLVGLDRFLDQEGLPAPAESRAAHARALVPGRRPRPRQKVVGPLLRLLVEPRLHSRALPERHVRDRPDGPGWLEGAEQLRPEQGGDEAWPEGAAQARRSQPQHYLSELG